MASAYSQPHDYGQYIQALPMEIIATGLAYKQGKYDANRAKLQSFLNNFSQLDILKEQDREYFMNNLQTLRNKVEQFGMGDLSQNGVTDNLIRYIGQAGDENVARAVAGTKAYRKVNAEAENIRIKHPEKYSQLNLQYSLRGLNKWLNDGKVGSDWTSTEYGTPNSSYIPYTDVMKRANEIIKTIEPEAYAVLNPMDKSGFSYYNEEGKKITDERIRSALEAQLMGDAQVQQQLQVNAWGQFGGLSDAQFVEGMRQNYDMMVTGYDTRIADLNKELITTNDPEEREMIQQAIDFNTSKKEIYTDLLSEDPATFSENILDRREALELELYSDNFMDGMVQAHAYNSVTKKGIVNDQGQLTIYRQNQANLRQREKLAWEREKFAREQKLASNDLIVEATKVKDTNPDLANVILSPLNITVDDLDLLATDPTYGKLDLDIHIKADEMAQIEDQYMALVDRSDSLAENLLNKMFSIENQSAWRNTDGSWKVSPSEAMLSIKHMFNDDYDITNNDKLREKANTDNLKKLYGQWESQEKEVRRQEAIKDSYKFAMQRANVTQFGDLYGEGGEEIDRIVSEHEKKIGRVAYIGDKFSIASPEDGSDGYILTGKGRGSEELFSQQYNTLDELKQGIQENIDLLSYEENMEARARIYDDLTGSLQTGLTYNVNQQNRSHIGLYSDLISQAIASGKDVSSTLRQFENRATILEGIKSVTKVSDNKVTFDGGTIKLNPVTQNVELYYGSSDKPEFSLSMQDLAPNSLSAREFLQRSSVANEELGAKKEEEFIFQDMQANGITSMAEVEARYIPFPSTSDEKGHFRINMRPEFVIKGFGENKKEVIPYLSIDKMVLDENGIEQKVGTANFGDLNDYVGSAVLPNSFAGLENGLYKAQQMYSIFLRNVTSEAIDRDLEFK